MSEPVTGAGRGSPVAIRGRGRLLAAISGLTPGVLPVLRRLAGVPALPPPRPDGLTHWGGLAVRLAVAAGIIAAVDPRFGGVLAERLLHITGQGTTGTTGLPSPTWVAVTWAVVLLNACLLTLTGATVALRRLYTDPLLQPVLQSPVPPRLVVANRLLAVAGDLTAFGRVTLFPLLWVVITGQGTLSVRVWALLMYGLTVGVSAGGGFLSALLVRALSHRGWLGGLLAPPVAMAPALLVWPLTAAGPGAATWPAVGLAATLLAALGALAFGLAGCYRQSLVSNPGGGERRPWRPVAARGGRSGPTRAMLHRDLNLIASNPVTYLRLLVLLSAVVLYPAVEGRLADLDLVLLPGVLGLPLAYAFGAWFISVGEVSTSLGQVDRVMKLTLSSAPCRARQVLVAGFRSNLVLGLVSLGATGAGVYWLSRATPGNPLEAMVFFLALPATAIGQAALSAKLTRAPAAVGSGSTDLGSSGPPATGLVGFLLEQVPLSQNGLRSLGILAGHLLVIISTPVILNSRLGATPASLVLVCVGLAPLVVLTPRHRTG